MRHTYKIEDGSGEKFWYSAENKESAFQQYQEDYEYCDEEEVPEIVELPDNEYLKIYDDLPFEDPSPFKLMTCGQWAAAREGCIGATLYG